MASIFASVYLSSMNCLYRKFFGDDGRGFCQHSTIACVLLAVCHQLMFYLLQPGEVLCLFDGTLGVGDLRIKIQFAYVIFRL